MKRLLILTAAALFAALSLTAKEVNVLTIGNSFADSVFKFLPEIAKSVPDCSLVLERANHGGCELERHWRYISQEEADPSVKIYRKSKKSLKEILKSKKWDIVTIQQASHASWRPETYFPYAQNIFDYVKKNSPDAEVVIQQTWAYRADDPRISQGGAWQIDQTEMFRRIEKNYADAAKKLNLRVIPSGQAVQKSRAAEKKPFKAYDRKSLPFFVWPDLPPQASDVVGNLFWRKDKSGNLAIAADYIHLNIRGQYLQACVWFGFLFDKDPAEIKFVPDTIGNEDAAFLRGVASKTLKEFKQPRDS